VAIVFDCKLFLVALEGELAIIIGEFLVEWDFCVSFDIYWNIKIGMKWS
jgi:hypothetical protein